MIRRKKSSTQEKVQRNPAVVAVLSSHGGEGLWRGAVVERSPQGCRLLDVRELVDSEVSSATSSATGDVATREPVGAWVDRWMGGSVHP